MLAAAAILVIAAVALFLLPRAGEAGLKLSEDLVYAFVKGLFDYKDDITAGHAKGNELDLNTAVSGVSIPWHAGAVKFYTEKGLM